MPEVRIPIKDNPCKECMEDYRELGEFINGQWRSYYTRRGPSFQCRFCVMPEFSRFSSKTGRTAEEIMYGTRTQV